MSQALPAEAPLGDVVERVDPRIGAREGAAVLEVGVHDDGRDVVGGEGPVVALDPHVLEALRAVAWLETRHRRPRRR
jgi:hypothetical protein